MADQPNATVASPNEDVRSMRTVLLGSAALLWILTLVIIFQMQSLNTKLTEIKDMTTALSMGMGSANLDGYEVLDDQGNVVYRFQRRPDPIDPSMLGPDGMPLPMPPIPAGSPEAAPMPAPTPATP